MELNLKPAIINELDLTKESSLKSLAELSDLDAKNICDTAAIDDCISDAVSYIASFIKIPKNPTPLLKNICVKLTILELKRRNDFPKDTLEEIREWANELLLKMANKKIPTEINKEENFTLQNKMRAFKHTRARMDLKRINN